MNYINIHIGSLIKQAVIEQKKDMASICSFMKCTELQVREMFMQKSMDTDYLLKWSKLLDYDFFRMYTQHLILYAPSPNLKCEKSKNTNSQLPQFRKNIYTREIIDYILEQVQTKEMTIHDILVKYRIPKTTIYKWISKYKV